MIQIDDTIVSFDIFDVLFLCDLSKCHGMCCVEGDAGAPLEPEEVEELQKAYPIVKDMLPEASRQVIESQGVSYVDSQGDLVTQIVNGRDCVFAYTDTDSSVKCALDTAYRAKRIPFRKPVSCYLYPVRIDKFPSFTAVNVHKWSICKSAFECGASAGLPVYRFLKEPLIFKFGRSWYDKLCIAAEEYRKARKEWRRTEQ